MKSLKLLLIYILLQANLFAQVSLKTGVSRSTINIGDYIKYYIIINYDQEHKLTLPPPGKELGKFDIKDYNIVDEKSEEKGKKIKKIEYTITAYFIGEFDIPSIEIIYEDKKKNKKSIRTEPLLIKVVPVKKLPSDTDDIRDIKEPENIKSHFWLYLFIILLIAGAAVFAFFYYKKYFKKETEDIKIKKLEKIIPEDIEALEKIKKLQQKGYLEKNKFKIFYFEISEIIRGYLHRRYDIYTLERTSYEIMIDIRKIVDDKNIQKLFNKFFRDSDMVKFAKYKPSINEIKGIVGRAIQLINITKRKFTQDASI